MDRRQIARLSPSASGLLRGRTSRSIALVALAAGWGAAAYGTIAGAGWVIALGFLVFGVCIVALAKLLLETRTQVTSAETALKAELRRVETTIATTIADLSAETQRSVEILNRHDVAINKHDVAINKHDVAINKNERGASRAAEQLSARLNDARKHNKQRFVKAETALAAIEEAIAANRRLLEKVARQAIHSPSLDELAELAHPKVKRPTLSIAIPSYNRPELLAECLDSLEREINAAPNGAVEVCITDDASSDPDTFDVAADFVRRTEFSSLHANPSNLGLERNLLHACEPCRGDYVLVLGNDDRMCGGALVTILADVDSGAAGVYLYDRTRISLDGQPIDRGEWTVPIDIAAGAHVFPTLIDAVRRQGILSTLGFISTVVFQRAEIANVTAEKYLDLTMYPLVFIIVEALWYRPLQYRHVAVVQHRTPKQAQKWSESVGKREEQFMRGSAARGSRYFGTALAASLQRLVDTGAVDPNVLAELPERLLTNLRLVEWIAQCRQLDPTIDDQFGPAVVADADRFFEAVTPASKTTTPRIASRSRSALGGG